MVDIPDSRDTGSGYCFVYDKLSGCEGSVGESGEEFKDGIGKGEKGKGKREKPSGASVPNSLHICSENG